MHLVRKLSRYGPIYLHAEENPQKRLTLLKAELGKTDHHKIILRNPSNKETTVRSENTNPGNFDIEPPVQVIPPYTNAIATIHYIPSKLDDIEHADI